MSGLLTPPTARPRDAATAETARRRPPSRVGDPTWEVAEWLYPRQGRWTRGAVDKIAPAAPHPFSFDRRTGTLDFRRDGRTRLSTEFARESVRGEPTWELAELLHPRQGEWTEDEYIKISSLIDRRVEFVRGFLDIHDMVELAHALLCRWLFLWLHAGAADAGGGEVFFAPATVPIEPGRVNREPDLFVLRPGTPVVGRRTPDVGDLLSAFEVVSRSRRSVTRDRVTKRAEYAAAGVPEYWVIDRRHPDGPHVLVLTLPDGATPGAGTYAEHGTFRPGDTATSPSLPGLTCDVAALFAAAEA